MKQEVYDFIPKPFKPDYVALIMQKTLERERLKGEVEILSEAVGERYRLVIGQSVKMKQAIDVAKKVASSKATPLLPLTVLLFPTISWRVSYLVMKRGLLPELISLKRERWNWQREGRFFLMRLATFLLRFKLSSSGFSKSGNLIGWEEPNPSMWM